MVDNPLHLIIHGPADLAKMHIAHAERIKADPGIKWGVPSIDKRVIPLRPGDLIALCGRPGAGKSSLAARMAKKVAQDIVLRGASDREGVFYVTWEQTAEELMAFFAAGPGYSVTDYAWGRVDMEVVKRNAFASMTYPLWVIGNALKNAGKRPPRLTIETVCRALEEVQATQQRTPKLIVFDYLQLIPLSRPTTKRTEQVNETVVLAKELAQRLGTPVIANVQASRDVDLMKPPLPRKQHSQHSSAIEQHIDKFFGLWRPWTTEEHDTKIKPPGYTTEFPNSPDLLILKMDKQRMDDGSHTWALRFSPEELLLADLETETPEPVY